MNIEEIKKLFMQEIDCSQVVAGHFAKACGMDEKSMRKVAACFGGGMQCGETCGAVTGALMVIGMKYGHCEEGDQAQKMIMAEKTAEFKRLFAEKRSSCICKELLGHDLSQPGELEKVMEEGLLLDFCPGVVEDAIEVLEKIL